MLNKVIVTNESQLQTALTNAATQPISCITIEDDIIELTAPLVLPKTLNARSKQLIIEGNGTTLAPNIGSTLTHLMRRTPANQTEALNTMQSHAFFFRNINFVIIRFIFYNVISRLFC